MKLVKRDTTDGERLIFWCPGCKELHSFRCNQPESKPKPAWTFNGDYDKPTFNPSLRMFTYDPATKQERTLCHLVLTSGVINFCGDCPHELAGKSVPLEEIPENQSY